VGDRVVEEVFQQSLEEALVGVQCGRPLDTERRVVSPDRVPGAADLPLQLDFGDRVDGRLAGQGRGVLETGLDSVEGITDPVDRRLCTLEAVVDDRHEVPEVV